MHELTKLPALQNLRVQCAVYCGTGMTPLTGLQTCRCRYEARSVQETTFPETVSSARIYDNGKVCLLSSTVLWVAPAVPWLQAYDQPPCVFVWAQGNAFPAAC